MVRARLHSVHLKQALCHVWWGRGREGEGERCTLGSTQQVEFVCQWHTDETTHTTAWWSCDQHVTALLMQC